MGFSTYYKDIKPKVQKRDQSATFFTDTDRLVQLLKSWGFHDVVVSNDTQWRISQTNEYSHGLVLVVNGLVQVGERALDRLTFKSKNRNNKVEFETKQNDMFTISLGGGSMMLPITEISFFGNPMLLYNKNENNWYSESYMVPFSITTVSEKVDDYTEENSTHKIYSEDIDEDLTTDLGVEVQKELLTTSKVYTMPNYKINEKNISSMVFHDQIDSLLLDPEEDGYGKEYVLECGYQNGKNARNWGFVPQVYPEVVLNWLNGIPSDLGMQKKHYAYSGGTYAIVEIHNATLSLTNWDDETEEYALNPHDVVVIYEREAKVFPETVADFIFMSGDMEDHDGSIRSNFTKNGYHYYCEFDGAKSKVRLEPEMRYYILKNGWTLLGEDKNIKDETVVSDEGDFKEISPNASYGYIKSIIENKSVKDTMYIHGVSDYSFSDDYDGGIAFGHIYPDKWKDMSADKGYRTFPEVSTTIYGEIPIIKGQPIYWRNNKGSQNLINYYNKVDVVTGGAPYPQKTVNGWNCAFWGNWGDSRQANKVGLAGRFYSLYEVNPGILPDRVPVFRDDSTISTKKYSGWKMGGLYKVDIERGTGRGWDCIVEDFNWFNKNAPRPDGANDWDGNCVLWSDADEADPEGWLRGYDILVGMEYQKRKKSSRYANAVVIWRNANLLSNLDLSIKGFSYILSQTADGQSTVIKFNNNSSKDVLVRFGSKLIQVNAYDIHKEKVSNVNASKTNCYYIDPIDNRVRKISMLTGVEESFSPYFTWDTTDGGWTKTVTFNNLTNKEVSIKQSSISSTLMEPFSTKDFPITNFDEVLHYVPDASFTFRHPLTRNKQELFLKELFNIDMGPDGFRYSYRTIDDGWTLELDFVNNTRKPVEVKTGSSTINIRAFERKIDKVTNISEVLHWVPDAKYTYKDPTDNTKKIIYLRQLYTKAPEKFSYTTSLIENGWSLETKFFNDTVKSTTIGTGSKKIKLTPFQRTTDKVTNISEVLHYVPDSNYTYIDPISGEKVVLYLKDLYDMAKGK